MPTNAGSYLRKLIVSLKIRRKIFLTLRSRFFGVTTQEKIVFAFSLCNDCCLSERVYSSYPSAAISTSKMRSFPTKIFRGCETTNDPQKSASLMSLVSFSWTSVWIFFPINPVTSRANRRDAESFVSDRKYHTKKKV